MNKKNYLIVMMFLLLLSLITFYLGVLINVISDETFYAFETLLKLIPLFLFLGFCYSAYKFFTTKE